MHGRPRQSALAQAGSEQCKSSDEHRSETRQCVLTAGKPLDTRCCAFSDRETLFAQRFGKTRMLDALKTKQFGDVCTHA